MRHINARFVRVAYPIVLITAFYCVIQTSADASLPTANDILEQSRAKYASLNSYSDTGEIINEFGHDSKEKHSFITYFSRVPRGFFFDFSNASGDRYVVWGDPQAFHTWWKTTGVRDDYPNPSNTGAFTTAGVHSIGATGKIPTLLYAKASLQGAFTNFADAVADGTENIGGHKCYRLVGTARDIYGITGRESNVRKMIVWIDADSLLIRKVVEEWPPLPGQVSRYTTIYEPLANPTIDAAKFQFSPPK